ncbi:MAG: class I SAM-dependent methyltransferase [Halobacteriaceae archaeon]
MSQDHDPVSFYDEYGEREWERLERDLYHRLEWEETKHFLDEYLPTSGRVLDVGGGAGRYSAWLADRGYEVVLVDPSETQVSLAREKLRERDVLQSVDVQTGDVRDLSLSTNAFAATLCLGGPLSHVLDAEERRTAVQELKRVTAPDGPVFVSVMGKLAALQTIVRGAGRVDPEADETELLPRLTETGTYDQELLDEFDLEPTAAPMHLFRVDELERLLVEGGLSLETVTGLESIVSQRREDFDQMNEHHRRALRETVASLREDRGVARAPSFDPKFRIALGERTPLKSTTGDSVAKVDGDKRSAPILPKCQVDADHAQKRTEEFWNSSHQ